MRRTARRQPGNIPPVGAGLRQRAAPLHQRCARFCRTAPALSRAHFYSMRSFMDDSPHPWNGSPRSWSGPPHGGNSPPRRLDLPPSGRTVRPPGRAVRPLGRAFRPSGRAVRPAGGGVHGAGRRSGETGEPSTPWGGTLQDRSRPFPPTGRSIQSRGGLPAPVTPCSKQILPLKNGGLTGLQLPTYYARRSGCWQAGAFFDN